MLAPILSVLNKLKNSKQTAEVLSGYNLLSVTNPQDWEGYHRIQQQLFKAVGINYDPHHWTISAPNYFKFVFMLDSNIIGTAMIALIDQDIAILRTLAIDDLWQHQGHGTVLLAKVEEWIAQQGRQVIYLHSTYAAVLFYKRSKFIEMPFSDPEDPQRTRMNVVDLGKYVQLLR